MDSSDIVTLDNLRLKLPQWEPNNDSHTYAVVDMGRYAQYALPNLNSESIA